MPSIRALHKDDRPREKLLHRGRNALTNLELIQVIVGSGVRGANVESIARRILPLLEMYGDKLEATQLLSLKGISTATAAKLIAGIELAGRMAYRGIRIERTEDVLPLVADMRFKKQEHLTVLTLDGAHRLIERRVVGVGILNATLVHPREVYADAITDRAAYIIIVHNHPSGTLEPSEADRLITARLRHTGDILGIALLDHIIVTADNYVSIQESDGV